MSLPRWLITIVGFPIGGFAAVQVASTTAGPLSAALAGLIAGAVLGTAQWLALRPRVGPPWIAVTAVALAAGTAASVLATGGGTTTAALVVQGAIAGSVLAVGQGALLRFPIARLFAWAATVGGSWALAWLVTSAVIVDEQRGFAVFGLSGAAIVTLATGVVLRLILGARSPRTESAAVPA